MKYQVKWTIYMSRIIEADSKQEALDIAEDLGDIDADTRVSNKTATKTQ